MYRFFAVPALFCLTAASAFSAADSSLLALIPSSAKVVSSVNVQQALSSQFGQYLLSKTNSDNDGFDKMTQLTGFDPRRDLESFVFATSGPPANNTQPGFLIVARGTFDAQLIKKHILADGGTVQSANGVDIYVCSTHGDHQQQTAVALPDTGVAAFGDLASVQQAVANRAVPSVLDADLQALISKVSANNDAWFASILGGSYLTQHLNNAADQKMKPPAQALQSVRQAAGGVQFGDPVQFTFDAIARSPQDAVSLTDVVRFMAGFVQTQGQNNPHAQALASVLDNLTLTASGEDVHASLAIPEKSMEQLADSGMNPGLHRGFKPAPHTEFK